MGANKSIVLPQDEVQTICDETGKVSLLMGESFDIDFNLGFTPNELQRLYNRFQELEKRNPPEGYLNREDLLTVREVSLNPLGERLVDVIVTDYGSIVPFDRVTCHGLRFI